MNTNHAISEGLDELIEEGVLDSRTMQIGARCGCGQKAVVFCGYHGEWMCAECKQNPDAGVPYEQ